MPSGECGAVALPRPANVQCGAASLSAQTTLFHGDACEALGEDAALELVDWAGRRLLWLNSRVGRACAKGTGKIVQLALWIVTTPRLKNSSRPGAIE